jgi:hypothetical protein
VKYVFTNIPQSHPLAFVNELRADNDRYEYSGDAAKSVSRAVRIHKHVGKYEPQVRSNVTIAPYQVSQWDYRTSEQQYRAGGHHAQRSGYYGSGYGPQHSGHHMTFSRVRELAKAHGGGVWKWTWESKAPNQQRPDYYGSDARRLEAAAVPVTQAPVQLPTAESLLSQLRSKKVEGRTIVKRTFVRSMAPAQQQAPTLAKRVLQESEALPPGWQLDIHAFEHSMSLTAAVNEEQSPQMYEASTGVVAAFIDGNVRGFTNEFVEAPHGVHAGKKIVMMMIYGDSEDMDKPIDLKYWDGK